ncbi:MAG: hypothetical protein HY056_01265 [Proteobacteria bacterium]|nr:hypothetical protein [Pseudomonadota bacterium]
MSEAPLSLPSVPLFDARDGGPLEHARDGCLRARALRDACLEWLPPIAGRMMPVLDAVTRRWLRRSRSPYVAEIEAIAAALGFPGIWFLNGSYQWCCTALARDEDGAPWLARTLDWPYPGLGRGVEVARMSGAAGDFYSATWPGYVGVLSAMAPARFAAAINQAPMRRHTGHRWLRPLDLAANVAGTLIGVRHMPPDQLLRDVFENCRDVGAARARLEQTPVARPVIYTLVGCRAGERFVIERTQTGHATRSNDTVAANDWGVSDPRWEGRMRADQMLSATYDEAMNNSRSRREALRDWRGAFARGVAPFAWVVPPVLNPYTRVAVEMCPRRAVMRVAGYDMVAGAQLPMRVAQSNDMAAAAA